MRRSKTALTLNKPGVWGWLHFPYFMSDIKLIDAKIKKDALKKLVDEGFKDMVGGILVWKSQWEDCGKRLKR